MVNNPSVAIIGAGPYGLSIAAHLATAGVEHRIFGRPMHFWSQIANAGGERYLKSYCFGTNVSTPNRGFSFADYSRPRGLEVFEPCTIADFVAYGNWFQQQLVSWVDPVDVLLVSQRSRGFELTLEDGRSLTARHIVVATGLSCFAHVPSTLSSLPGPLVTHTANVSDFGVFKGFHVAVVGAGQSALEAAALLHEAGARPQLLVRGQSISWQSRVPKGRSIWRRLRSPISGLGTGPKAWLLTNLPSAMHSLPDMLRIPFVQTHLPAEGAWWLRKRVEHVLPVHLKTMIVSAREHEGRITLQLQKDGKPDHLMVDHVIAGTGYQIDLQSLGFLDTGLRTSIDRLNYAPKLSSRFESSITGLYFVGPSSSMSFGPLFRFVVGATYTAHTVATHLKCRQPALP